jgi:hypothetical protein
VGGRGPRHVPPARRRRAHRPHAPTTFTCASSRKDQDIDVADLNCDANDDEAVETTHADAKLIAAAPTLADALCGLLYELAASTDRRGVLHGVPHAIEEAQAALRAAGRLP